MEKKTYSPEVCHRPNYFQSCKMATTLRYLLRRLSWFDSARVDLSALESSLDECLSQVERYVRYCDFIESGFSISDLPVDE